MVELKVREYWETFTVKQFETFVNEIFRNLYNIMTDLRVTKGCICLNWIIPDIDTTELLPVLPLDLVRLIGVIYLHIGSDVIYNIEGEGCESIEAAMIQAVELKNTRAIELLIAVGCNPEVAAYNGDNAMTNIVNIERKWESSLSGSSCIVRIVKDIDDTTTSKRLSGVGASFTIPPDMKRGGTEAELTKREIELQLADNTSCTTSTGKATMQTDVPTIPIGYNLLTPIHDDHKCQLCFGLLNQPHLLSCCGNMICYSHISSIANKCPYCRETNFTLVKSNRAEKKIKESPVECTTKDCYWCGPLGGLEKHICPETKGQDVGLVEELEVGSTSDGVSETSEYQSQHLAVPEVFTCGCGDCSVKDWLEKGCKKPGKLENYPKLDVKSLSVEEQEILLNRLDREIRTVQKSFGELTLLIARWLSFSVPVEELQLFLGSFTIFTPIHKSNGAKLLSTVMNEINACTRVHDIFKILGNYWSWINYDLLKEIADEFCSEDRTVQEKFKTYLEQVLEPFLQRSVVKIPSSSYGYFDISKHKKLAFKLGTDMELHSGDSIRLIRTKLATILGVDHKALHIAMVKDGCMEITFVVPDVIHEMLFPALPNDIQIQLAGLEVKSKSCVVEQITSSEFSYSLLPEGERSNDCLYKSSNIPLSAVHELVADYLPQSSLSTEEDTIISTSLIEQPTFLCQDTAPFTFDQQDSNDDNKSSSSSIQARQQSVNNQSSGYLTASEITTFKFSTGTVTKSSIANSETSTYREKPYFELRKRRNSVGPNTPVFGSEAVDNGFSISLLERLLKLYNGYQPMSKQYFTQLNIVYRCHRSLLALSGKLFCDDSLQLKKRHPKVHLGPNGYKFVSSLSFEPSKHKRNIKEALLILVQEVLSYMEKQKSKDPWFRPFQVCIISSSRNQLSTIKEVISKNDHYKPVGKVTFLLLYTIQGYEFKIIFLNLFDSLTKDDKNMSNSTKSLCNRIVITQATTLVMAVGDPHELITNQEALTQLNHGANT